ncbi:hypothetical protein ACFL2Q_13530 [Thermodesulfobacteriota bacterium]
MPPREVDVKKDVIDPGYLQAILHEHDSLRKEILQRTNSHNSLLSWIMVGISAFAVVGFKNWGDSGATIIGFAIFLFFIPLLLLILTWVLLIYCAQIERAGEYIMWLEKKYETLSPRLQSMRHLLSSRAKTFARNYGVRGNDINALVAPLGWESWLRTQSIPHFVGFRLVQRHLSIAMPLICSVSGFCYLLAKRDVIRLSWSWLPQCFTHGIGLLIIYTVVLFLVGLLYNGLLRWSIRMTLGRTPDNALRSS